MRTRVLGTWVAVTLVAGVLGAAAGAGDGPADDVVAVVDGRGDGRSEGGSDPVQAATSTAPPTTTAASLAPGEPTPTPPPNPDGNPTVGDAPPDTRPIDEQGNRIGDPPPGGVLAGRVTDTGGRPLRGICVSDRFLPAPLTAVTDADGRWSVAVPPERGTQVVGIHFEDCDGAAPHALWHTHADGVVVVSGRTSTLDVTLRIGGTVVLTVVDAQGRPVPGACFAATGTAFDGVSRVTSGPDGRAVLEPVAPGPQSIGNHPCGGSVPPIDPVAVDVPEGGLVEATVVVPSGLPD